MKRKSPSEFAFLGPRVLLSFVLGLAGVFLALFALGLFSSGSASAQGRNQNQGANAFQVGASYHNDVSPLMRDLPAWTAADRKEQHEANENPKVPYRHKDSTDPVIQNSHVIRTLGTPSSSNLPSTILNFDGITFP